jgi:hypothetical protein
MTNAVMVSRARREPLFTAFSSKAARNGRRVVRVRDVAPELESAQENVEDGHLPMRLHSLTLIPDRTSILTTIRNQIVNRTRCARENGHGYVLAGEVLG